MADYVKPTLTLLSPASEDMRRIVFDSSSDEDVEEEQLTPLHISWLPLSIVEYSQYLGICALPGCRYRDVRRSLQKDVGKAVFEESFLSHELLRSDMKAAVFNFLYELKNQGVQDVFVFCTRGELSKYRVPSLLEVYDQHGFTVHHAPFPDGDVPELEQCCQILTELQVCLERNRKMVVHCYGGLGRSALIAACLLLHLSVTMTADKAIEILREHRGVGAIQTVKQYNFLHEFQEKYTAYTESREAAPERSVS
ncbi:hypothetical protein CCH79_00007970, partial [Gambusia affinis]